MAVIQSLLHYIGSAMPLAILCYVMVFIYEGRKVKSSSLLSYIVIAVLMFFLLLRT